MKCELEVLSRLSRKASDTLIEEIVVTHNIIMRNIIAMCLFLLLRMLAFVLI